MAAGKVRMDPETLLVMNELRDFMFANVYMSDQQSARQQGAIELIRRLVDHLLANQSELPANFRQADGALVTQVVDYVAGMTDRFAIATYERLYGPAPLPTEGLT
jgi:dGTPase